MNDALEIVNRAMFLPESVKKFSSADVPLNIGYGQTNSQPSTVRMMLEWLDVQRGHKVLDIGSGSGWTTALLARLVGPEGVVFAVEIVPELVNIGRQNCARTGIQNVQFFQAKKELGLAQYAPFDRILVSASARKFPKDLTKQLKQGGKLVIPVRNTIYEVTKQKSGLLAIVKHPGFVFVPLI